MSHRRANAVRRRPALSLLEVLVALAIFLLSTVAISHMILSAGDRAMEVRYQSEGTEICQDKLWEVASGALPLSSQDSVPLDEDPSWSWSVDAEQASVANLWSVTVRATRAGLNGTPVEYCSLSRMVLDPSVRGSTQDTVTMSSGSGSNSSGSSPSSGGSTPSSSGSTPPAAAATPARTGAAGTTPAAGTGTPRPPSGGTPAGPSRPSTPGGVGAPGAGAPGAGAPGAGRGGR